ncbi:hypothetical protein HAZT_HAZT003189 [Hyalella azteca]|uniref:GATA zinc finger domain-containing protein 1 n=1 Tax=Hyalella azteca TaxID=294128 RepID=A0A6A0HAU3_HYAAZ|nr:hypothetical protein HAZT_HAZT003189 [Hyalella azteca]
MSHKDGDKQISASVKSRCGSPDNVIQEKSSREVCAENNPSGVNNRPSEAQGIPNISPDPIISVSEGSIATKGISKNKIVLSKSSTDIDEKILSDCHVSIQRCSSTSKSKRDEAQDGKEEETRQDTKRKSRKCKQTSKANAPRGKGRRFIFKKNGQYWQVGDIVSVQDVDGGIFYCQVRGLLQDQYCEKSAALTWLLPTIYSPPQAERFDPATYIIGPEEEIPRKMEYLTFVCHAPSDYYKLKNSPYPTSANLSNAAHVWASMSSVDVKIKSQSSRS